MRAACVGLLANGRLPIELRPDNRCPTTHHGAVDFDLRLIAADRGYSLIAGPGLLTLERLATGQLRQLGGGRSSTCRRARMAGRACLVTLTSRDRMEANSRSIRAAQCIAIGDGTDTARKVGCETALTVIGHGGRRPEEHRQAHRDDEDRRKQEDDWIIVLPSPTLWLPPHHRPMTSIRPIVIAAIPLHCPRLA